MKISHEVVFNDLFIKQKVNWSLKLFLIDGLKVNDRIKNKNLNYFQIQKLFDKKNYIFEKP